MLLATDQIISTKKDKDQHSHTKNHVVIKAFFECASINEYKIFPLAGHIYHQSLNSTFPSLTNRFYFFLVLMLSEINPMIFVEIKLKKW